MDSLKNTPVQVRQAREWAWEGRRIFLALVERLSEENFAQPSLLPGWSRAHVIAHIANNAKALRNLATWARTGVETPMYASPEQRNADIESGAAMAPADLRRFVVEQSEGLSMDFDLLTPEQWAATVRTAQGRTVPVTEVPWMRAREVLIHSVDLDAGIRFADLPQAFNAALIDEIVAKRSAEGTGPALRIETNDARGVSREWNVAGVGDPVTVIGPLYSATAWMTGRPVKLMTTATGDPLPVLPRWL